MHIMKEYSIKVDYRQPKRKRVQEQETYEAQNTLNRQFEQAAANQVWVTDTTEIAYNIRKYKVRLHVVLDLYGQYPLSWIITPTETSTGAIKVFQMAKQKAGGLAPLIPLIAEQHILPKHSTTTWLVITANIVTQPQEHQLIIRWWNTGGLILNLSG